MSGNDERVAPQRGAEFELELARQDGISNYLLHSAAGFALSMPCSMTAACPDCADLRETQMCIEIACIHCRSSLNSVCAAKPMSIDSCC